MPLPRRILVVDDDAVYREQVAAALRAQGFEVTLATNPNEAEDEVYKGRCQFFVLDLFLGGPADDDPNDNFTLALTQDLHRAEDGEQPWSPFRKSWVVTHSEDDDELERRGRLYRRLLKERLIRKPSSDYVAWAKEIAARFDEDSPLAWDCRVNVPPSLEASESGREQIEELVRMSVRSSFKAHKRLERVELDVLKEGYDKRALKARGDLVSGSAFPGLFYRFSSADLTKREDEQFEHFQAIGAVAPKKFGTAFLRHADVSASYVEFAAGARQLAAIWKEVKTKEGFADVENYINRVFRALNSLWASVQQKNFGLRDTVTDSRVPDVCLNKAAYWGTGIGHGDLHPGNVLVDEHDKTIVLIDFTESSADLNIFRDFAVFEMHSALHLWSPAPHEVSEFVNWQIADTLVRSAPVRGRGRWIGAGIRVVRELLKEHICRRIPEAESRLRVVEKVYAGYLVALANEYQVAKAQWLPQYPQVVQGMADQTLDRIDATLRKLDYIS